MKTFFFALMVSIVFFLSFSNTDEVITPLYVQTNTEPVSTTQDEKGTNVKTTILISNFKSTVNSTLKSTKDKPLHRDGSLRIWHRGNHTKLISAEGNKIRLKSDFYIRKNILGIKTTIHPTVFVNVTASYNNNTNAVDLSYQIDNIKGVSGTLEKWLKTNERKYKSIPMSDAVKAFKGGDVKVTFSKPADDQLQLTLVTPLNKSKLNNLIK